MNKLYKIIIFFIGFVLYLHFFDIKTNITFAKTLNDNYESMITIEANSGRILYEKNKDKKLPMASTTKILTALVAIENFKDLDIKHKIPKDAVGVEGSSIYLKANEELSLRELLYGLMLRSGNDAAVAIAIIVSGSVEEFVKLMNEYCEGLGLKNTHIVTVNGLHDDSHYTTASDLSKITAKAMKNNIFKEIVATKEIVINSTQDEKNKCRLLKNKNKLLKMIDGANGVKTGYTKKAGKCFVGSAEKNNMNIICVVLNSKTMFDETFLLIQRAFSEYKYVKLLDKGEIVSKGDNKFNVILKNDVYYVLTKNELSKIKAKLNVDNAKNTFEQDLLDIGSIDFVIENDLIFSEKIYTIKGKKISSVKENFNKIIKAF